MDHMSISITERVKKQEECRQTALELLTELNKLLRDTDEDNCAVADVVRESIICHLKEGGAKLDKCHNCGCYKWKNNRNNNKWRNVCHDPHNCPSVNNSWRDLPETTLVKATLGFTKRRFQPGNMGVLRNDEVPERVIVKDTPGFRRSDQQDMGVLRNKDVVEPVMTISYFTKRESQSLDFGVLRNGVEQ